MAADSVAVTDDIIREIGEQVSQTLRRRMPRWGGTAFDLTRGVEMYRGHCGVSIPSSEMRLKDAVQKELGNGGAPNEVGVYVLKLDGKPRYTGRAIEDRPDQATKGLRKRLQEHARGDKNSSERIRNHREVLTVEFFATGSVDAAKALEARKIQELGTDEEWNKREEKAVSAAPDAARRATSAIATGVVSDLAVFAVGGAAMEIRDACRTPGDMPLLDRCERLVRAMSERLAVSLKDRSLREVGAEVLTGLASVLTAPLRMATAAVEQIVEVLRRLWMEFVDGKLKTLADVVAAALKAVFTVASVGVALALEAEFTTLFAAMPFGEILAAVSAAVVAGVMIVVGNRAIDHIVRSLFGLFQGADIAKRRREEIEAFCAERIPQLIADRDHVEALVETHLADREALFASTFADLRSARDRGDVDGFLNGLHKLNQAYGKTLPWRTHKEFDDFMLDDSQSLKL